jgi:hypothetical protein
LSLGITNNPWLWLYMISRGYSVLCVKTLFYFLNFISKGSDTGIGNSLSTLRVKE